MNFSTLITLIVALTVLSACGAPAPNKADQIRALPAMPMERSLAFFRAFCVNGGPDTSGGTVILERSTQRNGAPFCSMRSRAPKGVDEFAELRRRYGNAKSAGLLTQFSGYPGGPLLFIEGVRNGAGEGTYQVAIAG